MEKCFRDYKYLALIGEDTLWQFYAPAIKECNIKEGFEKFTQQNNDSYNRLKFRSMEERIMQLENSMSHESSTLDIFHRG